MRMGLAQTVQTVLATDEIHRRMAERPVDIVLVDASLARPDPVQFTRAVLSRAPGTGVVFVGTFDPRLTAMTVAAGARGVVRGGGDDGEDLVVALTQAIMLICPGMNGTGRLPRQRGVGRSVLTERELQVLRGMSEGKSNSEIGGELFVSEDTVKTHARRLFRKLGARDRAHAVAKGFQGGIVS